ncbi:MAG: U32 family peptidase [Paramuribaculum sp.]|nr:U32 family peptidase [Paramuribaculum sp.]
MVKEIELLAPARDLKVARAAIASGADAVYIGAPSHSARAAAAVTTDDIRKSIEAAHPFGVKVYVALNTLIYDNELRDIERMISELYRAGVDALIVQDPGITKLDLPPIALHASTQCDIRTPEKALWLESLGFTRIVPARELTIKEIADIHEAAPRLEIEAFVHGALCVSYSGDCRASHVMTGRSANRGECSQICRHAFTLLDCNDRVLVRDKYLLSLRDLNRSAYLGEMLRAGVESLKIEGRLKDESYVMDTVGYYRQELDRIIEANPELYKRASHGTSRLNFTPSPELAFNRGFTSYFTEGHNPGGNLKMATLDTTGRLGTTIGRVRRTLKGGGIVIDLKEGVRLSNGDGLAWTNRQNGTVAGMRVNRAEGNTVYAAPGTKLIPTAGTELRRTADSQREKNLEKQDAAVRTLGMKGTLRITPGNMLTLDLEAENGAKASAAIEIPTPDRAEKPQKEQRLRALNKTGDSIYRLTELDDRAGNLFIPASYLSKLRREAIDILEKTAEAIYAYPKPGQTTEMRLPDGVPAVNVANHLSRELYDQRGATVTVTAIECQPGNRKGTHVMNTRYCLRRELGMCLRTAAGKEWQAPLYLKDGSGKKMRVDFDCAKCEMNLYV